MIRAYDEELLAVVEPNLTVAEHVQRTILATTRAGVKEAIFAYLGRHDPPESVYHLLGRITSDDGLLGKTRIVSDRRYGNCVVLVTLSRLGLLGAETASILASEQSEQEVASCS